ncbi:MAG: Holliday junction branch migration protein RuvA [Candidatus Krumholzibacteria bacterium]|nr:Holliday junction branch migration protein RuvA [Candidatus Krumholzibacteria bacterium]MDH4335928.1 Holliday junction branch migration protein RuvA [Candidatus Krumholzibacteria bacterium]MDH5268496.1 Holliday junction branch migration protein RuvA [Candidatus Krumholzibacteria bacterium]MDH5628011.1 Holliday junction branch migration protein RuvA [Candidatus Krumholzibacteria bacterium]
MIARLRGRVVSAHPACVVEVGGVGFEVAIPEKDRETLSPMEGEVVFHTHMVVREDRMSLFGFLHRVDRDLFLKLIEVSGVGPKVGLAVLSNHPAARVAGAIKSGDTVFLSKIPGIGKKTAERIAMELKDKLDAFDTPAERKAPKIAVREEVLLALTSLGMTRGAAESALDRMEWNADETPNVEDVVRRALRYASGG